MPTAGDGQNDMGPHHPRHPPVVGGRPVYVRPPRPNNVENGCLQGTASPVKKQSDPQHRHYCLPPVAGGCHWHVGARHPEDEKMDYHWER